ncbi:hypothetical protein C805_02304 [Eubacterium sp. 14-2]|uniref:DUF4956 domain-containing protein n=1 Tax=Eubacterium sp. 14-2 TaxID=1235790 RepID=UPI00033AADFA|nr:DUF4956 domain-containing protein [Eubacterium sp. 14-2]EOT24093.1 hypothetical protein C805_02304 [Eubacterium sp. 14-2]
MFPDIFKSIFETGVSLQPADFLLCLLVSLAAGIFLAVISTYGARYTQSFVVTLALLPPIVCTVILLVNGSIGAGVAVAGAFNLVRFRSVPGSAQEICAIFLAMGTGLTAGMGYLSYAVLFSLILGTGSLLFTHFGFGIPRHPERNKILHITIPENLDYTQVFDEPLETYTSRHEIRSVKTTAMGSLYKLTWQITLKNPAEEKNFIDALRCRNGNLEIVLSRQETGSCEL